MYMGLSYAFFFLNYLFMTDTERETETETQAAVGARCGTQSQDPGIMP